MTSLQAHGGDWAARRPNLTDLRLLAAALGVLFLANPVINVISPGVGDLTTVGTMIASLLPILSRANRVPRLVWSLGALVGAYAVGSLYIVEAGQAWRHVLATASAAAALLLFATYGRDIVAMRGFRRAAYAVTICGIVLVAFSHNLSKNLQGGTMLYLGAVFVSLLIYSRPKTLRFYSLAFVGASLVLAFVLDFRSLIAYTVVILLGNRGANRLQKRTYWLAGISGLTVVVGGITWYFLNASTNALAISVTRNITDVSGRRATSGRDVIWSAIGYHVKDDRWFGLGAGMLPQDIIPTTLSSHSTFMQTYLQLGYLGLVLLVVVLLAVWRPLAFAETASGKFGAAIFLLFVAHNATEVLMFQNALLAAIPAWCAIGLAIALAQQPSPHPTVRAALRDRVRL